MDLERINELGFEKTSKWKTIVVIVSFSRWWRLLIAIQCYITCLLCIASTAFHVPREQLYMLLYAFDLFYVFEIICTIYYHKNVRYKKLKFSHERGWFLITIDIISVVPVELFYVFYYARIAENYNYLLYSLLIQNRDLRIYRVFQLEVLYLKIITKYGRNLIFLVIQFAWKILLIGHILTCVWANMEQSFPCEPDKHNCILWYETNMVTLILLNWSGDDKMFRKPLELILVTIALVIGLTLIYGSFYPSALLISTQYYYNEALYLDRIHKAKRLLDNMLRDEKSKRNILNHIVEAWQESLDLSSLLFNLPVALKKEIFTDIYWEVFRHSELLRDVSRNCKRSLSLVITIRSYHAGEVIYLKQDQRQMMLFLVKGTVEIMAEENEESALLTFSSGTVFGELSLFLCVPSQVILRCRTYCEFQVLTMVAVTPVLSKYPKDRKTVWHRLQERIAIARQTQWRKNEFTLLDRHENIVDSTSTEECVKWLKNQWQALWEKHSRQKMVIEAIEEGRRLPTFHRIFVQPKVQIEFVSNYLDLIVLSDLFEDKKDVMCLKMEFPWAVDPSAPFLRIWRFVLISVAIMVVVVYPLATAWLNSLLDFVYNISFFVTGLFLADVFLKLFTAVKTRHHLITKFTSILATRMKEPTFYIDVIAGFPYQVFVNRKVMKPYEVGLLLHPAIFKIYLCFSEKIRLSGRIDKIVFVKNSFIFALFIYFFAEAIQVSILTGLESKNVTSEWLNLNGGENEMMEKYFLSIIRSLMTGVGIPNYLVCSEGSAELLIHAAATFIFFFFFVYFFGDYYGTFLVKTFSRETFFILFLQILKFFRSVHLQPEIENRLVKTIWFQWKYNNADELSSETPLIKSMSKNMKREICSESVYGTLQSSQLFLDESLDLITALVDTSYIVAVPLGSLLVSQGHTSHMVMIIHRGVCQISSFLASDTEAGVGKPIIVSKGTAIPLLSSFCNTPAPISVISLTDCELITIHLDDLLKILMDFNLFKDILETLKELNIQDKLGHKPGLIGIDKRSQRTSDTIREKLMKIVYNFEKLLCIRRRSRSKKSRVDFDFFISWQAFYVGYIFLLGFLWPASFGLLAYASHVLLPLLCASKFIMLLNILINFHTPYYNQIGILVTHPRRTTVNYLTSNFLLDFLAFVPVFSVFRYCFRLENRSPPLWLVFITFIQIVLSLRHPYNYLTYKTYEKYNLYPINVLKILFFVLSFFHLFINFTMFAAADWIYEGSLRIVGFKVSKNYQPSDPHLLHENSIIDYYLIITYWMLTSLTTNPYRLHNLTGTVMIVSNILSCIGTFFHFHLYTVIASSAFFHNLSETIFQEKITSFVRFLEMEDTNSKIIETALAHYNYEWSKSQGENLKNVLDRLPVHIHEELVYPLYRPTLGKLHIFAHADEGFHKILSLYLTHVHFSRGSVIYMENQVSSDVYFVHKGKCFVFDWFLKLEPGSLIGDIRRTGIIRNKIYALTHVELLRISSKDFFMILNNFDVLEAKFFALTKTLESFIKYEATRRTFQNHPVDSKDVLNAFGLQNRVFGFEDESYFEEPNKSIVRRKGLKLKTEEKKRLFIIYPGSLKMQVYEYLIQAVTFFTFIALTIFAAFAGLTNVAFAIFAVLDFLWLVVIGSTFCIGYTDGAKGDVITNFRFIAKMYVKRWNGFVLDLIALIPFELIYLAAITNRRKADRRLVVGLRCFRCLRGVHALSAIGRGSKKVAFRQQQIFVQTVLVLVITVFFLAFVLIFLARDKSFVTVMTPYDLTMDQFVIFISSVKHVLNILSSANLSALIPSTRTQLLFELLVTFLSPYLRGILTTRILTVLYSKNLVRFRHKSAVVALEAFLENNEASPIIIKEVLDYKFSLLEFGRSENTPACLIQAPLSLRIAIAKDIYYNHLRNCPIFEKVIVEQFDVDQSMYFIHKGEVFVINQTKDRAYVEYVVGKLETGNYFGLGQGLWFSLPHAYTYRARTLVEVLTLHADSWIDMRRSFPREAELIFTRAKALRFV